MKTFLQQARLRALAGTRRAHQNDDLGHKELSTAECQFAIVLYRDGTISIGNLNLAIGNVRLGARAIFRHHQESLRSFASQVELRFGPRYPWLRPPESAATYPQSKTD